MADMQSVWNPETYDSERRRLVPCFDDFYGSAAELVARSCASAPLILDIGAGTGLLSATIAARIPSAQLTLLDLSPEMLQRATTRLAAERPQIVVGQLTDRLPEGPFDAVVSALAIHHLSDPDKQDLYARILGALKPGGVFVNAEQVSGASDRLQQLFEVTHLETACRLGSTPSEIDGAIERMRHDQCATVDVQLAWLTQAGFADVECFYRWFRFAVFGGWRPRD